MAMLDAVMSPGWRDRYFSYDADWSPVEQMASMRDGCGNDYSIVFSPAGAYARGFDHESPMSPYRSEPLEPWPGLFDTVPEVFRDSITEPAFCEADGTPRATVCFWREATDTAWRTGALDIPTQGIEDADGAEWLFEVLIKGGPEGYRQFAEEYYEVELGIEPVRHVYALRPLTQAVVEVLNPAVSLADLGRDRAQIGYPPHEL